MNKKYVKIDGIHCPHCIDVITKELMKNKNIKEVIIKNNIAHITYNKKLTNKEIINTINNIDYFTKDEYISDNLKDLDNKIRLKEFIIIVSIILLIWFLINIIFGYNIFNVIPNIDSSITFGMLFITGLLTSIHCISMCGAFNLLAIYDSKRNIKRPLLYNIGRVLSYTIIGFLVGLFGSLFKVNDSLNGVIVIVSSIIIFLMSLNILGVVNFKFFRYKLNNKFRNPFLIGLLNGLMPCGPLQAMEIYALSTGNMFTGALSMFLFGIGTVPLMFSIGFIYNLFKGKIKIIINKVSAILILILSIFMFSRGLLSFNIDIFNNKPSYDGYIASKLVDNYQVVEIDLSIDHFEDIVVKKGIPVKFIINVEEKNLTTCNNWIMMRNYDVLQKLEVGQNVIEFVPTKTGDFFYTCRMNMLKNNIKVVDDEEFFKGDK